MLCSLVLTVSLVFGQLGLKATCKTTGPDSLSRQAGGTAAALLRSNIKVALVILRVFLEDGQGARYACAHI